MYFLHVFINSRRNNLAHNHVLALPFFI